MIFNYDKETGSLNNGENLSNLKQEIVDFFTKKQDVVKPYELTKGDNDFFTAFKKKITSDEINSNSENAIELTKKLANQYSDCAGAIENIIEKEGLLGVTEANLAKAQSTTIQGVTKFRAALTSVGSVIKSVGASMLNMGIAMVASWVIGKIFEGFEYLAHYDENIIKKGQEAKESIDNTFKSFEEGKQKISDAASSFSDSEKEIQNTSDAIDVLAEKYTELHKGVNNSTNENISLSTDDYQEYLDISNQIAEIAPSVVSGYDSQNNAIIKIGDSAKSAAQDLKDLYESQMNVSRADLVDSFGDLYKSYDTTKSKIEKEKKQIATEKQNVDTRVEVSKQTSKSVDKQKLIDSLQNSGVLDFTFDEFGDLAEEASKQIMDSFYEESIDAMRNPLFDNEGTIKGYEILLGDNNNKQLAKARQIIDTLYSKDTSTVGNTEYKDISSKLNALKVKESDNNKSITTALMQLLQMSYTYDNLDPSLKNVISGNINNLDLNRLSKYYDGDLEGYGDEIIGYLSDVSEDQQKQILDLGNLDKSKLTLPEYTTEIRDVMAEIFGDDTDIQNQFMQIFGLVDNYENLSKKQNKIKQAFGDNASWKWINSLSIEDLNAATDVLNNGFDVSEPIENFISAINDYKSKKEDSTKSDTTLASILGDSDNEVSSSIDSLQSDISSLSTALQSLKTGDFKDSDLTDLIQQFPQLADQTDNLQEGISNLQADKLKSTLKKIDDSMDGASDEELANAQKLKDSLIKSVDLSDISSDKITESIKSAFEGDGGSRYIAAEHGTKAAEEYNQAFSKELQNSAGREAFYKATLNQDAVKQGPEAVRELYNQYLKTTKDIIQDSDLQSQLTDYQDKYQALYQAQKDVKNGLMTGSTRKTFLDKFPDLAKYAGNTEDLSSAIDDLMDSMDSDVTNQFADAIQALRDAGDTTGADALQKYVDDVIAGAHDIEGAYKEIAGLKIPTPQYEAAKDASSTENGGATYDDMLSMYKTAKEAYEKGLVGTDDFKTTAAMFSPTGSDDYANFAENMSKVERYFTEGSDGCINFLNDLQALGLAEQENGNWTYSLGNSMEELQETADRLGIGFEPLMSVFGKLEDYGFYNDFFTTEEAGTEKISDLYSKLAAEKMHLAQIKANPDTEDYATALSESEKKIAEFEERIKNANENMDEISDKNSEYYQKRAEYAKSIANDLMNEINNTDDMQLKESLQNQLDAFAKEYHLVIKTEADTSEIESEAQKNGVDLRNRPQVAESELYKAGYSEATGDGTATLYSTTFDNETHDKAVVVTPILPDGSIINAENLESYAQEYMKTGVDNNHIAIRTFEGSDWENESNVYANALHNLQSDYYDMGDLSDSEQQALDTLKNYNSEVLKNIDYTDGAYKEYEDAERAMDSLCDAWGIGSDYVDQLINALTDMGYIDAAPQYDIKSLEEQADIISPDIKVDLSATGEDLDNQISELTKYLNDLQSETDVDVNTDKISAAQDILGALITQKQELEAPAVMNVDTSMVSGKIGEAIGLLQQFQQAQNELSKNQALGIDTSEAQANVDSIVSEIQGLDANVKATLSIDDTSVDTIQDSINSKLTNEVMVKAGIDDSAIIGFQETKHDAKGEVDWDNDTSKVDAYASAEKQGTGTVVWGNDETLVKKEFTAVGKVNWQNSNAPTNGGVQVNGNAHSSGTPIIKSARFNNGYLGTAHANGTWGEPHNTTALTGELGQELVVRGNQFFTVGDNGPEMVDLKKNDIVFNHMQTRDILTKGYTTGRGRALASGNARAYKGAGDAFGLNKGKSSSSSNSTSTTKADTKATKEHTSATKSSTKNAKKVWDWVEIRLKWWSNQVKKISDKITDYIDKATKQSLLKQQMTKMNSEIKANEKGAAAYMKKANKVAKSYTYYNSDGTAIKTKVSKKYQKLVQKGAYRIEDMDTSTDKGKALAEAIEQYQTWYNKAQDCKQAVVDLKKEQMELFEQWANMPTEKAEKSIDRLTAGFAGLNATQSRLSAAQTGGSTQAAMIKATKDTATQAKATAKQSKKAVATATDANKKAQSKKKDANNELTKKKSKLLSTKGLSNAQKTAISKNQKIDTSKLKGTKKRRADAYNKALTNKKNADKAASTAKSNLNSAKSKYNTDQKIAEYLSGNVSEADAGYSSSDELSYMNTLVDKNVDNLKQVAKDRDEAYKESARNSKVYEAKYSTAVSTRDQYQKDKDSGKTIASQYSKQLTRSQRKALKAGKTVSLKGIKDKDLLNKLKKYNTAVKNLPSAITAADDAQQQYNITLDAEKTAAENAAQAEIEAAQAVVQAVQDKFDNTKSYYEKQLSYQEQLNAAKEKEIELSSAHGNYEKSSDYDVKISNEESTKAIKVEEKKKLEEQLQAGLDAGIIKKGTTEWINMQTEIASVGNEISDCDTKIEELKQSKIGVYYEEQFDRAIDRIDQFIDRLGTLKDLISDDMKVDKNTGLFTEWGATSIMLNRNQFNSNLEEFGKLAQKQADVKRRYANGEDMSSEFGEKTYDEYIKDIQSKMSSILSSNSSLNNEMLSLIKNQAQAELDVLNKVISKRKEALQAKKDYYDYDKTLKNKTKDIQVLERQIAALQGSTNAADKARLAQLQEQLSDAQEDLSDTITDHAYSMQSDALDKLSSDMSDDFEKWSNDISSNVEKMSKAINEAVKNAGQSNAQVLNNLSAILKNVGLSDVQIAALNLSEIKGYASGTSYVPKSDLYRVNENGMESVLSRKYGTLTFLNQGDKVFTADFTKSLLNNAVVATQSSQPQFGEMYKEFMNAINNTNSQSYGDMTVNFYIDGAKDIDALKTEIYGTMKQVLRDHDKKQVRDFKSLR